MTFIPGPSGNKSTVNSNSSLATTGFNSRQNTAQSGSTTSIVLDASAFASDDTYNDQIIGIVSGTGIGQHSVITDYNGTTKVALATFQQAPDSTSEYIIYLHSGSCQRQTQTNKYKTVILSSGASSNDDFYNGSYIQLFFDNVFTQTVLISDYNGTTKTVTLNDELKYPITTSTKYIITGEGGTAASATSTTIVLEASHGHSGTDDYYNNLIIEILSGTGIGQIKTISDYTGSTRTATVSTWDTTPDATSIYVIYGGWVGSYELVRDYTQLTAAIIVGSSEEAIIDFQLSFDSNGANKYDKTAVSVTKLGSSVHTLPITSDYFRFRIIGIGSALNGEVQVLYHNSKNKALTSFVGESINDYDDCEITKSVLTGKTFNGLYKNILIDYEGKLVTHISNPGSAFGELLTTRAIPSVQISHIYNIDSIAVDYDAGTLIGMTIQGNPGTQQVQTIYTTGGAQFTSTGNADYFNIYDGGATQYYVWFDVDNGNDDPSGGGTGIEVDIGASDSPSTVASALQTAIDGNANFSATILLGNLVSITNAANGDVTSIQPGTMPTSSASLTSHDSDNSMVQMVPAAGIGAYAVMRSNRGSIYRPGQGIAARFTAVFTTGVSGSDQIAGIGNQVSGLFFGYNGTSFGIMHRSSGHPDIYKLTITTGASGSGNVLVTLEGIDFPIAVTSGTAAHNAYEIYSAASTFRRGNWLTDIVDDTVYFLSTVASGARTKTYAFSANGVASIASTSGVIVEKQGSAIVNTWIPQDEWNVNKMQGIMTNTNILDPTKGNVYEIVFQWLGFGQLTFRVEDNTTGVFEDVHKIKYSNTNTVPSMTMPSTRILFASYNTTGTNQLTLKNASAEIATHGDIKKFDRIFTTTASKTTLDGNETAFLTVRNNRIFSQKGNNTEVEFKLVAFTNDANKSGTVRMYLGGTIGETNFTATDSDFSSVSIDTTNTTVPSGGRFIYSVSIAGGALFNLDIDRLGITLHNNQEITFTIQRNTTTNVELLAAVVWQEDR